MPMSKRSIAYYAVTRERGENWEARLSMRQQEQWDEHALFMNALVDDGFVVLGGPLGDGEKTLLIIDAESEQEIDTRLAEDPAHVSETWRLQGYSCQRGLHRLRVGRCRRGRGWCSGSRGGRSARRTVPSRAHAPTSRHRPGALRGRRPGFGRRRDSTRLASRMRDRPRPDTRSR